MAASLLKAGHQVTVYNRTPAKVEPLVAQGAKAAAGVADACRGDAVITMLAATYGRNSKPTAAADPRLLPNSSMPGRYRRLPPSGAPSPLARQSSAWGSFPRKERPRQSRPHDH